jgi:hypothetical protein
VGFTHIYCTPYHNFIIFHNYPLYPASIHIWEEWYFHTMSVAMVDRRNLHVSGKSLYRGKGMVPYVYLSFNCGIGCWTSNIIVSIVVRQTSSLLFDDCTCGTIPSPCIKISLLVVLILGKRYLLLLGVSLCYTDQSMVRESIPRGKKWLLNRLYSSIIFGLWEP